MTTTTTRFGGLSLCSVLATLLGCGAGEAPLELRVWGEAFIEDGIPAAEFDDGWAVSFERFEVELRDVSLAGLSVPGPATFDLVEPSEGRGQLVGQGLVGVGEHADAEFTIASMVVEGSATRGAELLHFTWSFPTPTRFHDCETTTEVEADGGGELQITIHADHLFYDSLVANEPSLRFDAIAAADLDGDGEITQAELASVDIGPYDPGNQSIDDLWSFIAAQARTAGHVDGEGHCASE